MKILITIALMALFASSANAGVFDFEFTELSPGVWTGVRDNSPRVPVMGSTSFVISEEGVVVFDGGGVPLMSEHIIQKIRSITALPVTHVAISHWHGDHNFGIYRFAEEFPNVQFIGHSFTRAAMVGSPIEYIERRPDWVSTALDGLQEQLDAGVGDDGETIPEHLIHYYQELLDDAEIIDAEYQRLKVTPPSLSFDDVLRVHSGTRTIEFLYLGDGNTAGDIVMWLPEEKIVATGDIVVHPTPYGFNVPPRRWAATLQGIQDLGYTTLVPGHGAVQHDNEYVDLLIECSLSIADQTDTFVAAGMPQEKAEAALDFSAFETRFTRGDAMTKDRFDAWFVGPFRKAAFKALTGEAMVLTEKKAEDDS